MGWKTLEYKAVGWPDLHWRKVPNTPALYALYANIDLIYIGQTVNLRHRLMEHRGGASNTSRFLSTLRPKSRISVKYRETTNLDIPEMKLIHRLQPPANVIHTGYRKSRVELRLGLACGDFIKFD